MTDSVLQQVRALLGSHFREVPVENGPNLLRLKQELRKIEERLPDFSGMLERLSKFVWSVWKRFVKRWVQIF